MGRFELRDLLGRGGLAEVWRAWDPRLGREVALKLLLSGQELGSEERLRFATEGKALARVRDPGLVQVFESAMDGATPYLAMEIVPGETLATLIARQGAGLPVERALGLALELARTLDRLHRAGVIHRDVKPGNAILTPDGRLVLLDLGMALLEDRSRSLTRSGETLGTPGWMAPEQVRGEKERIGPATDVFAAGALLYALLTGRAPFRGASSLAAMEAVLTRAPVAPSKLRPEVPRAIDALVLRCLHKEPGARPADGAALVAALEGLWRRSGSPSRLPRAGIAAGAGLIAAGLGVAWLGSRAAPEPAEPAPAAATSSAAPAAPASEAGEPAPLASAAAFRPSARELEAREALLAGLERVDLRHDGDKAVQPGAVCLVGEEAWPILTGRTGGEEVAWVCAARHGQGRVVVIASMALLDTTYLVKLPDAERLLVNAIRWASQRSSPRVVLIPAGHWVAPPARPGAWKVDMADERDIRLAHWLTQHGASEATYTGWELPELGGWDLVVWTDTHLSAEGLARLEAHVHAGGGLIVALAPWRVGQKLGSLAFGDLSWNAFLAPLGLFFSPTGNVSAKRGAAMEVRTVSWVHAGRILTALEADPGGKLGPALGKALGRAFQAAPAGHALRDRVKRLVDDPRVSLETRKRLLELAR